MREENKWLVRAIIAIICIVAICVFSSFALWGDIDMDVFWKIFTALNVYPGAWFVARQVEKSKTPTKTS